MGQEIAGAPQGPVAVFNERTGWAGRRILFSDGRFVLEGHGPIGAGDVMDYDGRGQLSWPRGELRGWVMELAVAERVGPPPSSRPVERHRLKGRSPASWKIALVVAAVLLVCALVAAEVVRGIGHQLLAPPSASQGSWKTYTNAAGGYRVSYPVSFHEQSYDSDIGDPGLCVRFIDTQGALYALSKGELLSTVIVVAKKLPGQATSAGEYDALSQLVQREASFAGDDPSHGMWDIRTLRSQMGEFHGLPCAIREVTYRCKRGGRQHDIIYVFYADDTFYHLQLGTGQHSWARMQPLFRRFADSFSTP